MKCSEQLILNSKSLINNLKIFVNERILHHLIFILYLINYMFKKALMLNLSNVGDNYQFPRIGLHLAMKILLLIIFLQLFYTYLAADFFPRLTQNKYNSLYFFQKKI